MNYRSYELPTDRTADSFNYKIDALDIDVEVDTIYTDDREEAMRILGATLDQGYNARITTRATSRTFVEQEPSQ